LPKRGAVPYDSNSRWSENHSFKEYVLAAKKEVVNETGVEPHPHALVLFLHFGKDIVGLPAGEKIPENFVLRISETGPVRAARTRATPQPPILVVLRRLFESESTPYAR
jgi:hypothetical protein